MTKIRNNGKKIILGHFEIGEGIIFLPKDFFDILDIDTKLKKKWDKLVSDGVMEFMD